MKKLSLLLLAGGCLFKVSTAQISEGGLPLSLQKNDASVAVEIPVTVGMLPDWNSYLKKEQKGPFTDPYMVALFTPASVHFPEDGIIEYLEDGSKVWKAKIHIAHAPAIGLYYDRFQLPQGTRLFLFNENKNQVLGAFTSVNNKVHQRFATEPVQGSTVNIELNIDEGVDINTIVFSVENAAVFFRAIEHLSQFTLIDGEGDASTNGTSSVCMINSVCPQGENYSIQRKATVGILQPVSGGLSACTGTMVNNTGNTETDCKQYFLTASHCDPSLTSDFTNTIFRFNYEHNTCTEGSAMISKTLVGGELKARSTLTAAMLSNPNTMKGDFMLLEIDDPIPPGWDISFAGWDNNPSPSLTETAPRKFIGFHHPAGDSKKLSTSQTIESLGLGVENTHWGTALDEGYAARGSSGSGLFNGDGYIIGVASVAGVIGTPPSACTVNSLGGTADAMNAIYYSKVAHAWEYALDGSTTGTQLKPWLDPANTGVTTIEPVTSQCAPLTDPTSVMEIENELGNAITLYPNPANNGTVHFTFNLKNVTDLQVEVFDINGKSVAKETLKNVKSGNASMHIGHLSGGMYLVKLSTGFTTTIKKLVVSE